MNNRYTVRAQVYYNLSKWCIQSSYVFSDSTPITLANNSEKISYELPNNFKPQLIGGVRLVARKRQNMEGYIRVIGKEKISTEYG